MPTDTLGQISVIEGQGAKAVLLIEGREAAEIHLTDLVLLSASSHRDSMRVGELGTLRPVGITRGPRAVAGTIAFTVLDKDAFEDAIQVYRGGDDDFYFTADELPPFDLLISMTGVDQGALSSFGHAGTAPVDQFSVLALRDVVVGDIATQIGVDKPTIGQQYVFTATDMSRLRTAAVQMASYEETFARIASAGFGKKPYGLENVSFPRIPSGADGPAYGFRNPVSPYTSVNPPVRVVE